MFNKLKKKPRLEEYEELIEKEFNFLDLLIIDWMKRHGLHFVRYSLAIVFIWFGILKPFGVSPAAGLVEATVYWFDPGWFVNFLGWWEVLIGFCLFYKPLIRTGIFLMAVQMVGTFLPLILLPSIVYSPTFPLLTLEGQYIIKNIVLIGAAMVIGAHVREKDV